MITNKQTNKQKPRTLRNYLLCCCVVVRSACGVCVVNFILFLCVKYHYFYREKSNKQLFELNVSRRTRFLIPPSEWLIDIGRRVNRKGSYQSKTQATTSREENSGSQFWTQHVRTYHQQPHVTCSCNWLKTFNVNCSERVQEYLCECSNHFRSLASYCYGNLWT